MFNDFYRALVLRVANDTVRPQWLPGSQYAQVKPAVSSPQ